MTKRIAVYFILLCYALTACGSLLETGCCHNDLDHQEGEHASQRHFISKSHVAAHLLNHAQEIPHAAKLTHGHCCCVRSGSDEAGQPPHAPARPSAVSNPKISSYNTLGPLAALDLRAMSLGGRELIPLGNIHCHLLTFQSISSTILLI